MDKNEFDILSIQFICKHPLEAGLLQECLLRRSAPNSVYITSTVLIDETSDLENTVYTMYKNYQQVIEEVKRQLGTVNLYITHHTQKARELVMSKNLLKFLAEKEIDLGVD